MKNELQNQYAPVAQLDRVDDYESSGRRFDSCRAHHICRLLETLRNQGFCFILKLNLSL